MTKAGQCKGHHQPWYLETPIIDPFQPIHQRRHMWVVSGWMENEWVDGKASGWVVGKLKEGHHHQTVTRELINNACYL